MRQVKVTCWGWAKEPSRLANVDPPKPDFLLVGCFPCFKLVLFGHKLVCFAFAF